MTLTAKTAFLLWIACGQIVAFGGKQKTETKRDQVKTGRFVYKQEPRRTLTVYYPDGWKATDERPALVIFRCRIPEQREHFRRLGMVIVKPVLAGVNSGKLPGMSLDEIAKAPKPRNQVEDSKSAIRWLRANCHKLGIDPERIAATGTSGGGDLALQSSINKAFEDPQDDRSISHRPDALVLYCPAFDGINIWFVKSAAMLEQVKADAPSFEPLLSRFVKDTEREYVTPLDHRANLIELAARLGDEKGIESDEVERFQQILKMFNERDWQLLHPADDALKMSASRILTKEPLPPTLIMFGTRDHLYEHQQAFVKQARSLGQQFTLKIYEGGGHSFMMQPAFMERSTREVETFLRSIDFIDDEE
ncbi:alpha/beta hydrolase [Thalassoroseus pseudoceratinae]|uniref:alpha/beta hydrolase n=1 Tax=Thalassoroseus pseudoceratinae TaxID=2713176 RepID=UPI0014233CB3|nr:alpha/beta hydrolase [Thalassoroseus pseudoceratinae]